ncbi:hypothetical protein BKA67DRAFT_695958 [Truncatella angustata]|uniref:Apple domain-containing protein n=1 Tax=Truncatella angustata TaxID=152316 RepID=A0A9P8U990_9PEZI|nr:uncharacterized protein BKA67DRAFT_695958 [Truncatella angustata]KAH6646039.1 hypothetical protein BKA67DRAFT_695958 [Truncatella angustata]
MDHQQQQQYHQQGGQAYYPPQEKPADYVDHQYGQQFPQQYHDNGAAAAQSNHVPHDGAYTGGYTAPAQTSGSGPKRGLLITLIAALAILAATVIGLAAGLGVSQNHLHSAQSDLDAAQASLSSAASAPTVTVTSTKSGSPTKTSSSATASATADKFSTCPGANNTIYTSGTDSKQFKVLCGVDSSGEGQSDDLNSTKAATMTVCMDACAKTDGCQGAGWGYIDGSGNMCYMKTNLTGYHNATASWEFATLATLNTTSTDS